MQPRNPIGLFHKKARAVWTNEGDAFHLRRVCSCPKRRSPSSKVDLHVHSLSLKSRKNSLPLSCRYLPLPAACTMAPYSCWLRGSHKGLAAKERASALWSNTKATWRLIFCETLHVCVIEWACVRVMLEVCSPFPQSQLCTGSWPRCPTVRRRRCAGWLHSSPGSLSPVEYEEGWEEKGGKGHIEIILFK